MSSRPGKSYKKVRKEDKNKKKLKTALKNVSTKTQLPKGQNLTDTNFKVKKIVIRDQVKPHDPGEILYHKKLNVSELTARLGHHNCSIKTEALDGLKAMIADYPVEVLGSHYIQVLEAVIKLVLDETASIRKSACKIVGQILSSVARHKLVPVFASLNSYLLCGLTHIDKGIREDGLLLLDACLHHVPEMCEKFAFNLLAVCLDLISEKNLGSRTLSLNLESSQVATKWRTKVLERIYSLLSSLVKDSGKNGEFQAQTPGTVKKFISGEVNHFPIYTGCILKDDILGSPDASQVTETGDPKLTLVGYFEAIVPLLLGMFLEVNPVDNSALHNNVSTVINDECSKLLHLIVGIIHSLWILVRKNSKNQKILSSLTDKFSKSLIQTIIYRRYPYSVTTKTGKSKKDADEHSNVNINLSVARLILNVTDYHQWDLVIPFLKNCFRTTEQFSQGDVIIFADSASKICLEERSSDNAYFFSKIVQITLEGRSQLCPHFFRLLGNIALNPKLKRFHDQGDFKKWLSSLPEKLTKDRIQPHQLDVISKIAVRGFPSFLESLDVNVELILDNIPRVLIADDDRREAAQWKMATLMYWVQDWDEELTESLKPAIESGYWGDRLTKYITETIALKTSQVTSDPMDTNDEVESSNSPGEEML